MCGIFAIWLRETGNLSSDQWLSILEGAEKRGGDSLGIHLKKKGQTLKYLPPYDLRQIAQVLCSVTTIDEVVIGISRATPETEIKSSDYRSIQPIILDSPTASVQRSLSLVHNGSVADDLNDSLKKNYPFRTEVDSEGILWAYIEHGRNMKSAMEWLKGAFAFILIDEQKNKLYSVVGYNPLSHMYIRGTGYFLHSDLDTLRSVCQDITGATRDGMNVWESWYCHELAPYTIIETDLESGFQFVDSFIPNYDHPTWDKHLDNTVEPAVVIASGGIDSGMTAALLSLAGYSVTMLHFHYGQRSEQSEAWAARNLALKLAVALEIKDISNLFRGFSSQLMDKSDITTGTRRGIKSTIAWVPGRNAIFTTIAAAMAEDKILKRNHKVVYLASGFAQLSEESGGYPDNSGRFMSALENMFQFGYITADRIKFLPVLQNLTKTETWFLGKAINFPFQYTVSCDNPIYNSGHDTVHLCEECGSTKLSRWAAARAGVHDPRKFYSSGSIQDEKTVDDQTIMPLDLKKIIDKLLLPEDRKAKIWEAILGFGRA